MSNNRRNHSDQKIPNVEGPPLDSSKPQAMTIRYEDQPISETFADSITRFYFDGQTLRMELSVTRLDRVEQGGPVSARRFPACRLVLSPAAAMDLIKQTQQISAALSKASGADKQKTSGGN